MKYALSLLVLAASVATAEAAVSPAIWATDTASSAHGCLTCSGINITATSTAPIVGLSPGQFGPSLWDGSMPLTAADVGLTVLAQVNTYQTFTFDSPLVGGTLMYIENFDSNSLAELNVVGGTATLVDASPSIGFAAGAAANGNDLLSTTNGSFNGEGDAVLMLSGGVTAVSIGYLQSDGANGVFYTFAEPCAVPEPTSAMVMAGLFGIGGLIYVRRRKQS